MTVFRLFRLTAGWLTLSVLLVPLVYAAWVSFSPDELLRPPTHTWSLHWYQVFLNDPRWVEAVFRSVVVAFLTSIASLFLGVPVALVTFERSFPGRASISWLMLAPLCIPPVVLGMGLLPLMHGLGLWGSMVSLVMAHALIGTSLVYLTVGASLAGVPRDLADAARGLGASPWQVFVRIILPLIRPGLVAGAALAFIVSLNEFFLALFLGITETDTLPRVIWPELRHSLSPLVAVGAMVTLAVTLVAVLLLVYLARQGSQRSASDSGNSG